MSRLPIATILLSASSVFAADTPGRLVVSPAVIQLNSGATQQRILVTEISGESRRDQTRSASFQIEPKSVAAVDARGVVTAVGNGTARLTVSVARRSVAVPVQVADADQPPPIDFERDIQPIFTRRGCNAGACHGKARGQNGFQLSLLGFDPEFDHAALTRESRGRRVFPSNPSRSLLLTKPTGQLPHGGGKRIEPGGAEYELLKRWITAGAPRRVPGTPQLASLQVQPTERILVHNEAQQLLVTAVYSDGSRRDVTHLAAFQSSESPIAGVDENGLVSAGRITGDAALMVRFMDKIAVCNVAVPLSGEVPAATYAKLPRYNFIDELAWQKLRKLRITPSEACSDHEFFRRAYIDVIGRTPTANEARAFLKDTAQDKRVKLIDHLLKQPEFAEHWANKWVDLLRPNPYRAGIKATLNFDYWIRDSFRQNKPWDRFVRELISARGSTFRNGAVTLFRDRRSPDELTTITSQLFLGIRLECAKCHHHPFEVWGQAEFYSFAAYFAQIGRKGRGVSPPISGSEEIVYSSTKGSVKHPLTGETMTPRPLFGTPPATDHGLRVALANWITSDENPYFAQVMVNRVWTDLMGRGLVEPVDDLRATNPPSNPALLKALADDFRTGGYDLKQLVRRIATSYVYGLSSLPNERNIVDTRNYSRRYRVRMRAEVLLDSIAQITGRPLRFDAMPNGSRAKELWTHRISSDFLDAFGRPDPNQDPPCERTTDTTIVQALHLMNSRDLYKSVTDDKSRAAQLAVGAGTPRQIVEEVYLSIYSRRPDEQELQTAESYFQMKEVNRRQATEDLMWALLNTPEFVFNH